MGDRRKETAKSKFALPSRLDRSLVLFGPWRPHHCKSTTETPQRRSSSLLSFSLAGPTSLDRAQPLVGYGARRQLFAVQVSIHKNNCRRSTVVLQANPLFSSPSAEVHSSPEPVVSSDQMISTPLASAAA